MDMTTLVEEHRRELTAYAYRMLGSPFDAQDAVQETFLRAWQARDAFKGEASARTWLYRILTNVCTDQLRGALQRVCPTDFSPASAATTAPGAAEPSETWLEPLPDSLIQNPAEAAETSESLRMAFLAAVQHLPARQRAALILHEVMRFSASETAMTLDTTPEAVASALARARTTLEKHRADLGSASASIDQRHAAEKYAAAFESYNLDELTSLLHKDVALSMPPLSLWVQGPEEVRTWLLGNGSVCRDSRLVPISANGALAFGQYHPSEERGMWLPWSINLVESVDGEITQLIYFLDTQRLFPLFGLPLHL